MQIRTQVYCFVLFLAALLTGSLVHSQVHGVQQAVSQIHGQVHAQLEQHGEADPSLFYSAVAQRFHVAEPSVEDLARRGLPPSQVVVVYFVAEHSLRQPDQIAADRMAGKSWRDIAVASGLQPEQFYYPLPDAARPPFVNVYALYHRVPRERWSWSSLALSDADVENMVNLQFLAGLAGNKPSDVVRMRAEGFDYVSIGNMLLPGQKTAEKQARRAEALRS